MTETKKKTDPRDIVLTFLIVMGLEPFVGIVHAMGYRLIWDWLIAPQYGPGPSLAAWFGLSLLVSLGVRSATSSSTSDEGNMIGKAFVSLLLKFFILGTFIVAAAFAKAIWGW